MPVSTGVSISKVTRPVLSHRAIARCAGKRSGIGLVETSRAIAVFGASSPGSGRRPIAQSSVKIFSCTCAHEVVSASAQTRNLTPFFSIKAALRCRARPPSNSLAPRGERVRVRDLCVARLSVAPHIFRIFRNFGPSPAARRRASASPLDGRGNPDRKRSKIFRGCMSFPGAGAGAVVGVAAIVAVVVEDLETVLAYCVLILREACRQSGT